MLNLHDGSYVINAIVMDFGLVQIYKIIDICSVVVYDCTYSFNTLLLAGTSIHELLDTFCVVVYTFSYLIDNIAVDSYTFVKQSIS